MKSVKVAILTACLSVALCFSAFAVDNGPSSLEDLQKQATETEAVLEDSGAGLEQPGVSGNDGGSAIGNIANSAKLDTESESARRVGNVMNSWAAKLMQIMGYVISIGLGLITGLDLCYIAIPPLRGILANGHAGTPDTGAQGQAGGMGGMGMSSGMGGMGMGMSGGMGMGMSGGMGMRGGMGANGAQGQQAAQTQWVTNAALNAVASSASGVNPFKVYFKQQAVVCIMAPTIFVLAATGVLSKFGFMLGNAISKWGNNISF